MEFEYDYKPDETTGFSFASQSPLIIMHCEKLLSYVLNKTAFLNHQQLTPPYIRHLLEKQNKSFRVPSTIDECVNELQRLTKNINTTGSEEGKFHQNFALQERSSSLIIFVVLIGLVSLISIIGNLCLAKVLYLKRYRLLQTDRIVLCLALSELCLVLIDSPTEIYRFLSYSFTQEWLCRFHTFFESLLSSCIIFYHLLGAFDRFVYIHGHTSSDSVWSRLCRRVSTTSGSIILLVLPILCSLPLAICNLMHAHVYLPSSAIKTCIVQYNHGILICFLIIFYIIPILFAFFLHTKLIYFILSKHHRHYSNVNKTISLTMKQTLTDNQSISSKKRHGKNHMLSGDGQELQHGRNLNGEKSHRRFFIGKGADTSQHIGTIVIPMSTRQSLPCQSARINQFNTFVGSRSSGGHNNLSMPSSYYKSNSQANANANRTVLLLVLLLSCYVLCWAPYNIYTWRHAYLSTIESSSRTVNNQTETIDFNRTIPSLLVTQYHSDLLRIILLNYGLYLLSMVSMCFSFIFYFTLNKQARREFTRLFRCGCPCVITVQSTKRREIRQKAAPLRLRQYHHEPRNQDNGTPKYPLMSAFIRQNERIRSIPDNHNSTFQSPNNLRMDNMNCPNDVSRGSTRPARVTSKSILLNYGCQVQCCR